MHSYNFLALLFSSGKPYRLGVQLHAPSSAEVQLLQSGVQYSLPAHYLAEDLLGVLGLGGADDEWVENLLWITQGVRLG